MPSAAEPIRISLSFASVDALSAWYTEYLVAGSAPLVTVHPLVPGEAVKLLVSVPEGGSFELAATVTEPSSSGPEPTAARVSLEARADLREHLARHALARRSGRRLSAEAGRRKHPRFETFLRARFRSFQHLMDEYVTNISRGGLFIRTAEPPPMGTMVCVAVTFPGETEPREISGAVVRIITPEAAARTGVAAGVAIAFDVDEASFGLAIDRLLAGYLGRSPRLLIVDDAPFFRRVLTDHLLENGYEVLSAPNGYVGAKLLAEHLYELDGVLLDLEMPGPSGWVLIDRIRQLKRETSFRLVVISGRSEAELETVRAAGGVDDVISKLTPLPELLVRVQRALGARR